MPNNYMMFPPGMMNFGMPGMMPGPGGMMPGGPAGFMPHMGYPGMEQPKAGGDTSPKKDSKKKEEAQSISGGRMGALLTSLVSTQIV